MRILSKGNEARGFTLVEIMIVVAIVGLLAAIAVPNHVRARQQSQQKSCINNIRQVDGAIQQYALENRLAGNAPVNGDLIAPYLKHGINTACPAGGTDIIDSYNLVDCQTPVTCKLDPEHVSD